MNPKLKTIMPTLIKAVLILALPLMLYAGTKTPNIEFYAVTVETTITDGITTESIFYMAPADEEYRIDGFTMEVAQGSSTEDSKNPFEDSVNDALSKLTANKGLKSVLSKQRVLDGNLTSMTVMKHQGFIKYPYKIRIMKKGPKNETNVEIEVEFSAFSMPSEWGWQRFKKSVSNNFSDVVSVFRQIWD